MSMSKSIKTIDHKSQSESFISIARELGCDEDPERFEDALRKVVAHKPQPDEPKQPKSETKKPAK